MALGVFGVIVAALVVYTLARGASGERGPANTSAVPSTASSSPSSDAVQRPVSLWIGDSYPAGVGASSRATAQSCLTADHMGWICNVDAQGGTGFIADGHGNSDTFAPLLKRLEATSQTYRADIIIVDAGRNDLAQPLGRLERAMGDYLAKLRAAYPDAELVQIVPYFMAQNRETLDGRLADIIAQQMEKYDGHVIDPVAEGWISEAQTGKMTISDHLHPNQPGHRYIAHHLAADLERMRLGVATD